MDEGLVVIVRAFIGFFSLLIFARIIGKEQISQLNFFDYVLGITIGSIAATLTTDLSSKAWPHWIGLLTWCALGYLMEIISTKWRYAAKYLEGEPAIVIMNGKIMENVLRKMKYRISEVLELLRNKGVFDVTQVDFAIIEPNGQISILLKPEHQPLTPKDMKIAVSPTGISTELVYDGIIIEENLRQLNKDKTWLLKELKKQGIRDISEVFLVTLNPAGSLYVDRYDDHLKKITDIGDYKGPY
ncbi:membrane protein [Desulfosporosinus sp. Tol-M]|nr:membrane protein [Desulfosporosinus sp. Tol-M]